MKIDADTMVANSADGPEAADVIPAETVEGTVSFVEFVDVVTAEVLRSVLVKVTGREVSADVVTVRTTKPFAPKVVKGAVNEVVKTLAVVLVPVPLAVVGTVEVVEPVVA